MRSPDQVTSINVFIGIVKHSVNLARQMRLLHKELFATGRTYSMVKEIKSAASGPV